ncbi:hypothetical protein DPMN_060990 [Dreissena polymorpha]|uniref:Uncharacterized protein n=1 Tax=Dreissena polymorpha TaxID=45954 RepID=A0A9D4HIS3_DREPO|nr:hypothetical protein DPMN_060990 [Dreissena polymorpha]
MFESVGRQYYQLPMFEKELYDLQVSLSCRPVKRSIAQIFGRIHITTWSDTDLDSHFYVKRRYLLRENAIAIEGENVFPD